MTVEERIAYLVTTSETLVAQLQDLKSLNEQLQKASAPAGARSQPAGKPPTPRETWRE